MPETVRRALIAGLFSPDGPEKLVVHVKTYQDISHSASAPEEMKGTPRYLCLTQKKSTMRLLKVKKNNNGSFHISKTWSLNDIKQLEIANSHSFSITLNKTYLLFVEKVKEKMIFLAFLIDCCKRSANHMPKLVNIDPNRTLMYLADPSAPTLGSSSFYNKSSSSSSSIPQRSSTTLVSLNSKHSPVKEAPNTVTSSPKNEPSSAPPKPTHREFNPPSQKSNSVSSENHFYHRPPLVLREGSTKYCIEEENNTSSPQTPVVISRNSVPRVASHTWSAYKPHPTRSSSSSTFNNRQEEQQPRRSLDESWQRGYPAKSGMIKAQPIRASMDGWQPHDVYHQQQSFDNTFRRSMDNGKSQRRNTTDDNYIEQPHPSQPNNQNKQSSLLAERPDSTEDIPIMADTNRPMSPTGNVNTHESVSPSMPSSAKNDHELYDEPKTYPAHRSSLPPIHPPTNLPRRAGSPMYIADRISRSDIKTYDRMDPYHPAIRKSIDSGRQSPSVRKVSYDINSLKTRDNYDPYSPTPIRKSMDGHRSSIKQELTDTQISKPRNSTIINGSPDSVEKMDSTPITKNTDGWQPQQDMNSSQSTNKSLPTLQKDLEPAQMGDHQGQTFSVSDGAPPKSSTLSNNAASAFKKVDPNRQSINVDNWKPLPGIKPSYQENVNKTEPYRISKRNTPPPIPKPQHNLATKSEEKIQVPNQPPAIPARRDIIIANHISGKNSPPPIPMPRQKEEEKMLISSESPHIPIRRDIPPKKINQTIEKEEANVYNKIDTVKRPVRRSIQEIPSSAKDTQQKEDSREETFLDNNKQVKKNNIGDTDYCLKGILKHIDKSIAELESMESWLALYGAKGGNSDL
ncbi:hypothetical protein K501DRAFT_329905 [Backusella circina FSU 941]|nr:hypothetical protein K501DRAFT_329905 [Backusella circina FSU 941]